MGWRARWEQGSEPPERAPEIAAEYYSIMLNDSKNLYYLTTERTPCAVGVGAAHI